MPQQPIATVDLRQVSMLVELVLRAGDASDPRTRERMRVAYNTPLTLFPGATGLSCLFRPGASLDDLAHEGSYPNPKLSYTTIGQLVNELASVGMGYTPVLFVTPTRAYPDHHTLAIARHGVIETALQEDALDALIRALNIVDNPYQQPRRP